MLKGYLELIKHLFISLALGAFSGVLAGMIVSKIFFLVPFFKKEMPLESFFIIFLSNSFLSTLICYGGIFFCLIEIKVYSFSAYKLFDRIFDPFYNFLGNLSKKIKRLKPMYRSCYFSLFYFPLGCLFLFSFLISTFFSVFINLLGLSVFPSLTKLFPHIFLETLVFSFSAFQALKIERKLEIFLFKERIKEVKKESLRLLKDMKIWRGLFICYVILLFSTFVEKFFVEL
ncbi:MAG: hypothetical protein QW412_02315 [Candidatus Aenigmatarchaeota archaeon]